MRLIFKPWLHISEKYFKNVENTLSEHQKLRKKIRKFSLKTAQAKKKNKKKTGSNVEKLRKLEPQQKQRVLIKKKSVAYNFPQNIIHGGLRISSTWILSKK